jgi:hypothetical protein
MEEPARTIIAPSGSSERTWAAGAPWATSRAGAKKAEINDRTTDILSDFMIGKRFLTF